MPNLKIAYLELPAHNLAASQDFYANLFGWTFVAWGPTYAAFSDSGIAGGFNADAAERTRAPLPVIESHDLEATQRNIVEAGGTITLPSSASLADVDSTSPIRRAMSWRRCRSSNDYFFFFTKISGLK